MQTDRRLADERSTREISDYRAKTGCGPVWSQSHHGADQSAEFSRRANGTAGPPKMCLIMSLSVSLCPIPGVGQTTVGCRVAGYKSGLTRTMLGIRHRGWQEESVTGALVESMALSLAANRNPVSREDRIEPNRGTRRHHRKFRPPNSKRCQLKGLSLQNVFGNGILAGRKPKLNRVQNSRWDEGPGEQ